MRPNDPQITIPPFERGLAWINTAPLKAHEQRDKAILVEFWDFCRVNSLRTLPYVKAWHERYADAGLRVVGIHTGGYPCSREPAAIEAAVARLGIEYPVLVDSDLVMWDWYGNQGWPARYLWAPRDQTLFSMHYGEGAYAETEREIGELLGIEVEPLAPVRPEDEPDAAVVVPSADERGAYEGPYEAGGVHLVCDGAGTVRAAGREITVDGCGCYTVVEHERHTEAVLDIDADPGVTVLATCFTPGLR